MNKKLQVKCIKYHCSFIISYTFISMSASFIIKEIYIIQCTLFKKMKQNYL